MCAVSHLLHLLLPPAHLQLRTSLWKPETLFPEALNYIITTDVMQSHCLSGDPMCVPILSSEPSLLTVCCSLHGSVINFPRSRSGKRRPLPQHGGAGRSWKGSGDCTTERTGSRQSHQGERGGQSLISPVNTQCARG